MLQPSALRVLLLTVLLGCGAKTGLEVPELVRDASIPRPAPRCINLRLRYEPVPPTVMLLVDRSGSMRFRFGSGTRWSVLGQALFDPERGMLAALDGRARFGLTFFTGIGGRAGTCPMLLQQRAVLGAAAQLRGFYQSQQPQPQGDTPTGESLVVVADRLGTDPTPGNKYILLVTDGEPDTCEQPNPQRGQPEALQGAHYAFSRGMEVLVLGVSDDIAPTHLQAMANAGSGRPQHLRWGQDPGAAQPYLASDDPRQLASQLTGILGAVRSCQIPLDRGADLSRVAETVVTLDGVKLRRGDPDGWLLAHPATVHLVGEACDRVLSVAVELRVRIPCS